MDPVTVGGMVLSAFLQVLFDRVASRPVLEFLKAKKLDMQKLEKLRRRLLKFERLLEDAEAKQIADMRVKKWLEELQDVVYDAEDLLDAINTEAMQRQLEKEPKLRRTRSMLNRSSSSRHLSVKKRLKLKLRNIFRPYGKMVTKLEEILQRLEGIDNEKDLLSLRERLGVAENPNERTPATSSPDERIVYGREVDKEIIIDLLLAENPSDDVPDVITIKGMGGIGKTTLAQLVYNDERIVNHFDLKAWVYISEEFDVLKVTRTILRALSYLTLVNDNLAFGNYDLDLLQVELKMKLMNKKFLLVLDDVWNENEYHWRMLKKPFQDGVRGSKILVTTRNEGVARIMRTVPTCHLEKLSEEDCWALFAKYAFAEGESLAHPSLREMGREIVKKCEGLPLAAKALGLLLRYKKSSGEWDEVMTSNVWDLNYADCNILPVLQVSYHHLPSRRLKRCFAFASIFPKNYEFAKDELILLWAAQSLFPEIEEGKNVEDVGGKCFTDLVSRSFFERSSANTSLFVMHNLMHDLATSVSGQTCQYIAHDNEQVISKMTRHISSYAMKLDQLATLPRANTLRTLIQLKRRKGGDFSGHVYGCDKVIVNDLLSRFKFVRVLSLSDHRLSKLPESIGSLKHVRYFDLSRTSIERLPNSICDLYNLQTLILKYCWKLIELPRNMWKLVNLHYLDVTGCNQLMEFPGNLGKLKNLERLSEFKVAKNDNGANIKEMGPLTNLHGELSISNLQNVRSLTDAADARLKDKKYLEKLQLSWDPYQIGRRKEYEVLEKLQPHRSLKELTIQYYRDASFPNWIEDQLYTNMESLNLYYCRCCLSLPMLGKLPSLKKLYISGFDQLQTWNSDFYGKTSSSANKPFESLEMLVIESMQEWEEWFHCDGEAFPLLQELCIKNCPKLRRNLPAHLPSLVTLTISNCPQLAASLPDAPALFYIRLESSNEMLLDHLPEQLMSLEVHRFEGLRSMPERLSKIRNLQYLELSTCPSLKSLSLGIFSSTLKSVIIVHCGRLELPMDQEYRSLERLTIEHISLQSIQLQNFPKLGHLVIRNCIYLESCSMPRGTSQDFPLLTHLDIKDCSRFRGFADEDLFLPNLRYFSFQTNEDAMELPRFSESLQTFILRDCPNVKSLPGGGLPSSLTSLEISGSAEFVEKLFHWGLHRLNSLKVLEFSGNCGIDESAEELFNWGFGSEVLESSGNYRVLKSFPAEGHLPESLIKLTIGPCSYLENFEYKGFQHLTSLSELAMVDCPEFKCLPPQGLPASLTHLSIRKCPRLEGRLRRDGGEDWRKIARIPRVLINDMEVLS